MYKMLQNAIQCYKMVQIKDFSSSLDAQRASWSVSATMIPKLKKMVIVTKTSIRLLSAIVAHVGKAFIYTTKVHKLLRKSQKVMRPPLLRSSQNIYKMDVSKKPNLANYLFRAAKPPQK